MKAFRSIRALGPIDLRGVVRDPLLRWMVLYPLVIALAIRWGVPVATQKILDAYQFDLVPYYPLLLVFIALMTPMLAGIVIGFLLLDEKDDQTLTALQITPLTLNGYLVYRLTIPMGLSFVLTILLVMLSNLVTLDLATLVLLSLLAAPLAPLYALTLAAAASNKVQGFAVSKALGVMIVAPLAVWFVEPPLQWLFGAIPLFWPAKFLQSEIQGDGTGWISFVGGIVLQTILLVLLTRRFHTVCQR